MDRGGEPVSLAVALPAYWWQTDLTFRHWSIEPRIYFASRPLSEAEKGELGVDPAGFASRVTQVDGTAAPVEVQHEFQPCISYQARLDGDVLVVRATIAPGWHTFVRQQTALPRKSSPAVVFRGTVVFRCPEFLSPSCVPSSSRVSFTFC